MKSRCVFFKIFNGCNFEVCKHDMFALEMFKVVFFTQTRKIGKFEELGRHNNCHMFTDIICTVMYYTVLNV